MLPEIEPARLYSFAEAAVHVPSAWKRRKGVSVDTLHRYRRIGLLACSCRQVGQRRYWFVEGAELRRFLGLQAMPVPTSRTPTQRERAYQAAEAQLRELDPH
jgi:hypothetical protein